MRRTFNTPLFTMQVQGAHVLVSRGAEFYAQNRFQFARSPANQAGVVQMVRFVHTQLLRERRWKVKLASQRCPVCGGTDCKAPNCGERV